METETCEGASVGMAGMRVDASGESRGGGGWRSGRYVREHWWGIEGATADGEGRCAAARWWRRNGRGGQSPQRRGYADVVPEYGENVDGWWAMTWMAERLENGNKN
jgi:hypothetical protein